MKTSALLRHQALRTSVLLAAFIAQSAFSQVEYKLTASDREEHGWFGYALAIDSAWAVVGAPYDSESIGSVYVYRFDGDSWVFFDKLTPSGGDLSGEPWFGASVALSGNRLIVGAPSSWNSFSGLRPGAAYIFLFDGSNWIEEHTLTATAPASRDRFGKSVSISGDRAIVGMHTDTGLEGAAYIFRFDEPRRDDPGGWVEEQKIKAADASRDDQFGWSVSIDSNLAIVGAPTADTLKGAAYVFRLDGQWEQEHRLIASDRERQNHVGQSVSISGNVVMVHVWRDAYLYRFNGSAWMEEAMIAEVPEFAMSVVGDWAVAGGSRLDVYRYHGAIWTNVRSLTPSDGPPGYIFESAALGDHWVIGSDYDNDGSAYIYDLRDIVGVEGTDPVRGAKPWMSAFPNPSSSTVMVRYKVPRWSDVRLTAYDLLGRRVRELASGTQPAGTYEVTFDATGLPSGIYFYRLQAGDYVETRRMVVVK